MKRLLVALGVFIGVCGPLAAAPSAGPAGNFIINNSTSAAQNAQEYNVRGGTVTQTLFLKFLTPGQCTTTDATGKVIGVPCGAGSSSIAVTTGASSGFSSVASSPTAVINFEQLQFNAQLKGSATAYISLNQSSVTLQGNNLAVTYLTNSSATATYLQLSSATANFLTLSSATATYFNKVNILPVANGGTGTSSPGLVAGTNITSITGSWPNQTINASGSGGGGGSPGGPSTAVQYNASGSFAGDGNFTYNGTSITLGNGGIYFPADQTCIGFDACGPTPPGGTPHNIAIGQHSTDQITSGTGNVGVGYLTHDRLTTGANNTSLGTGSGDDIITGYGNTCLGAGNNQWQPCQNILNGSSNTMVGAGTGALTEGANTNGVTYLGFQAGTTNGSDLTGAMCLGAYCNITSSFTARIGGKLGSGWEVNTHITSGTVETGSLGVNNIGYSWPSTVGASGGVFSVNSSSNITFATVPTLSGLNVWTGTNTWTSYPGGNFTYGLVVGTIQVNNLGNEQIPFANSLKTLQGDGNLLWDTGNQAMMVGTNVELVSNGLNVNGGAGSNILSLNETGGFSNVPIGFWFGGTEKGRFGMSTSGSSFLWSFRNGGPSSNPLSLNDAGTLAAVYGVTVGSLTINNVASGTQCLHADSSGRVTGTGSDCSSGGGGGGSSLETLVGVRITSPTNSMSYYSGDFLGSANGTTAQIYLNPATTDFIHNQATPQIAQFNVSSGAITGPSGLNVTYGVTSGSYTSSGSGAGAIQLFEGSSTTISGLVAFGQDVFYADSSSHTFNFVPNAGSTYTVVGSSAATTYGHCVEFSNGMGSALMDAGAACSSGGGGTPAAPFNSVQYNNAGAFGGSNNFEWNGTSVTLISSMTITDTSGKVDANPGQLDVFMQAPVSGQPLFSVGSGNQQNQLVVKDQSPLDLRTYGSRSGNLNIGLASFSDKIMSTNATAQNIWFWNAGEMDLQTSNPGDGGTSTNNIVLKPDEIEQLRISTNNVLDSGSGGLNTTYGITAGSITSNGFITAGAFITILGGNSLNLQNPNNNGNINIANNGSSGNGHLIIGAGSIGTNVVGPIIDDSSITIATGGLSVTATGNSFPYIAQFSTSSIGTPLVSISTQPAVLPSDYELTLTSAATPIMVLGIQADGHVVSSGTAPSMGTCGSSPSVIGTDMQGVITIGGGVVTTCTMNFANPWGNAPVCVESDNSVSVTADVQSVTQTAITFGFSATLGGGTVWYHCFGNKG